MLLICARELLQNPAMAGGPLALSRNFAVMTGVNAALSRALLRARNGVEDSANRCDIFPTYPYQM
jgi:hypothetical protein